MNSTPYTHPSMPGTPPDFPFHVVRSPFPPLLQALQTAGIVDPAEVPVAFIAQPRVFVWMDETKEFPTTTITEDS